MHEQKGQPSSTDRGQREEDDQRNDADRGREKGHVADPSTGRVRGLISPSRHVVTDVGRGEKCGVDRGGGCQQRSNGNGDEADSACSGLTGVGQRCPTVSVCWVRSSNITTAVEITTDHSDDRQGGAKPAAGCAWHRPCSAGGRGHAEALVGHVRAARLPRRSRGPAGCCLADPVGLNGSPRRRGTPQTRPSRSDDRGLRQPTSLELIRVCRGE